MWNSNFVGNAQENVNQGVQDLKDALCTDILVWCNWLVLKPCIVCVFQGCPHQNWTGIQPELTKWINSIGQLFGRSVRAECLFESCSGVDGPEQILGPPSPNPAAIDFKTFLRSYCRVWKGIGSQVEVILTTRHKQQSSYRGHWSCVKLPEIVEIVWQGNKGVPNCSVLWCLQSLGIYS